jgi:hypothetical protein
MRGSLAQDYFGELHAGPLRPNVLAFRKLFNQVRVDFQMELESQALSGDQENLLGTPFTGSQADRACGQPEGVAMPVKNRRYRRKSGEGTLRFLGPRDGKPAELNLAVLDNLCAESAGNELCAQANADDPLAIFQSALDKRALRPQPRPIPILINIHFPAHDNQEIEIIERRQWIAAVKMMHPDLMPPVRRPRRDFPRPLKAGVLEDADVHSPTKGRSCYFRKRGVINGLGTEQLPCITSDSGQFLSVRPFEDYSLA